MDERSPSQEWVLWDPFGKRERMDNPKFTIEGEIVSYQSKRTNQSFGKGLESLISVLDCISFHFLCFSQ